MAGFRKILRSPAGRITNQKLLLALVLVFGTGIATVGELVDTLGARSHELARVLGRCSYLCDGLAVRDQGQPLQAGTTIDVLPPFAGG